MGQTLYSCRCSNTLSRDVTINGVVNYVCRLCKAEYEVIDEKLRLKAVAPKYDD